MFGRRDFLCLLAAIGLTPVGCGATDPDRHEVFGQVTYKGQPVYEGIIDFEPLAGQPTRDGATIRNGAYRIPRDKGLFPGPYRVSIIIGDGTATAGNAGTEAVKSTTVARGRERAPPEFNTRSTLVREVTRGADNVFDFVIP